MPAEFEGMKFPMVCHRFGSSNQAGTLPVFPVRRGRVQGDPDSRHFVVESPTLV
jgi:hypothetical protein